MRLRLCASLIALAFVPATAWAQRKEGIIIFKDGFYISGRVVEQKTFFNDPNGMSFTIVKPGSMIFVDDNVRRIFFPTGQLHEVLEKADDKNPLALVRYKASNPPDMILPGWTFEKVTPWDDKWVRWFTVSTTTSKNKLEIEQRILFMTPQSLRIQTRKYNWDMFYFTKEIGPESARDLVAKFHDDRSKKSLSEPERMFETAKFLFQAGWLREADKELDDLTAKHSGQTELVKTLRDTIYKVRAEQCVEEIERAYKVGQHRQAQFKIAAFQKENLGSLVSEKSQLSVQDLKNKYDEQAEKLARITIYLKDFPKRFAGEDLSYWTDAAGIMLSELNEDTVPKLALFLDFATQHAREIAENKKTTQTTEQVLALAVTGWMLGAAAAEPDIKAARLLWAGRKMMLEYMTTGKSDVRARLLESFVRQHDPSADIVARLVRMLPPVAPYALDKINGDQIKLGVDLPDASEGTYLVQLPPGYHHQRQYPVLMLLHSHREKAGPMMQRLAPLAAQHGYILAAPLWEGDAASPAYRFTPNEHAIVLDSLRDLRRRFQVDSDRVFLFGWEQGADAAFDIALSHPDQFAGVVPMNGVARSFLGERYWPNAQYLPFYIVQGDRNGVGARANRDLFVKWVRSSFPSLYAEYKGRLSEWYSAELPIMFEWMNRKKRHFPNKEVGRSHTGGGQGEEFATMRPTDNRFYWLSTDSISDKATATVVEWERSRKPATVQANISVGNEPDLKQGARIWTQINIRTSGVKQLSIWLAPNMIDFSKPVMLRINGGSDGRVRMYQPNLSKMLEDFYLTGDKHRLWFERIDLKL